MHKALYYELYKDDIIKCTLCPHNCLIKDDEKGICSVRQNKKGKLYTLVYDKVLSAHIDPIEKKPLFHFLPGSSIFSFCTVGCNFKCDFCQNYGESQISKGNSGKIIGEKINPKEIVKLAIENKCESIAMTYVEPTIFYEFAYDVCKEAQKHNVKTVFVSNGYISRGPLKKLAKYLDAINIDLKSFNNNFYKKICGAKLQPVLDSIKLYHKLGVWVELTTLIIPDENDSDDEFRQIAEFIVSIDKNIPWHVSRFHPHYKMLDKTITPFETLKRAYDIGKKVGLNHVYIGNIPINEYEDTKCPKCKKVVIGRLGYNVHGYHIKNSVCQFCGEKIDGVFE